MSSVQRRRGRPITFWQIVRTTDSRGNIVHVADPATKVTVRGAVIPQRSARAEVVGQVEIDITRVLVSDDVQGVESWSRAEFDGHEWDVAAPPAMHWGQKNTRHWTIDLRQRPESG